MKTNRRTKKLLYLAIALCALCVICLAVSLIEKKVENIQEYGETVYSVKEEDMTAITISYSSSSYKFVKEDGVWKVDGDETFPIDQDAFKDLLANLEDIGAVYVIEDPESLSDYGLSNPGLTVLATTEERSYRLETGNLSNVDSNRYITTGDGNVYLAGIDPNEYFKIEPDDFFDYETLPSFTSKLKSFTIDTADTSLGIVYSEDGNYSYSSEFNYYLKSGSSYKELSTSLVKTLLSKLSGLSLSSYVSYNASDELSDFGLDNPDMTVSVIYEGKSEDECFAVLFALHNKSYYAMIDGSEIIYTIAQSNYDALLAANYEDLRPEELVTLDWGEVDSIDINLDGESYSFKLDGSEKDENGDKIDFSEIEDALDDITISEYTDELIEKALELEITLNLDNENYPALKLGFYRYDSSTCIVEWNGESYALVQRSKVVDLIEEIYAITL